MVNKLFNLVPLLRLELILNEINNSKPYKINKRELCFSLNSLSGQFMQINN